MKKLWVFLCVLALGVETSGVGWFQNGGSEWLPINANISYRVWDANKQNVLKDRTVKPVDCNPMVYP